MWGGIDFFVSLEVLVSSSIPPGFLQAASTGSSSKPKAEARSAHLPGNPAVRRFEFSGERRLTPMFVYPNATLFLQVLCSSGNRVHLMTPWSKEDTTTILKSSEWVSFLVDARRVSLIPGTSEYSFASLGIDPAAYVRTVLVVDGASHWSSVTALQLIEVKHNQEGVEAFHSMELLYALSRCIYFSEWLLRYPSSSIASCAALCSTSVFACCRFFFKGDTVDAALMLLVSYHGGRVVKSTEEATHIVLLPHPEPELSSASSSSVSSSTEDSSESDNSSSDGEEDRDDDNAKSPGASAPPAAPQRNLREDLTAPSSSAQGEKTSPKLTTVPSAAEPTLTVPPSASGPVVTPQWVHRCIRALRLMPLDEDSRSADVDTAAPPLEEEATNRGAEAEDSGSTAARAQAASKTKILLCCLLPPPDARPLIWTTFQSIARQHHFDTACLIPTSSDVSGSTLAPYLPTAATVLEALTAPSLNDVVEVRLMSATPAPKSAGGGASSSAARSRSVVVTRATLNTLRVSSATADLGRIALNRYERRRDKEVVFAHLQLIASQFLYSYEFVQRRRMQEKLCDAGTQTGGPRRASLSIMTEEVAAETAGEEKANELSVKVPQPTPLTSAAEFTESVDADEWRHHLKNVEGKLLSRHEHLQTDEEVGSADKKDEAPMSPMKDEGGEKALRADVKRGEDATGDQSAASPASHGASLFPQPLSRAHGADSIFLSAPMFPSFAESVPPSLYPSRSFNAVPLASESLYTSCFIPTNSLTRSQQDDFFVELRSYPIFSSPELGNNVVRLSDGAKCEFASHKAAEDFHRIDYIEFLSLHLPIYPYFDETADQQEEFLLPPPPQQPPLTEVDSLLKPVPSARNTTQQAQSLWTTPETAAAEGLRREWAGSMPPSLTYAVDPFSSGSSIPGRYGSTATTVPPYRSQIQSPDAGFAAPPSRKQAREGPPTGTRRSPEKRRSRVDDQISDDERPLTSSSSASKIEERSRSRRHHRDDSPRRRDDRCERHSSSSSGSRSRRRDERLRYSTEGSSSSYRQSQRGHGESRRRRSPADSRDD
ncbi:hypothetical protein ABL78_1601 [Leptomonas seymouri]|uniref:BRCT domain-containing protein n=1 Tax=Leptomonas seymouri TaxID=5684 RepID=A0A0N1IM23_LEPSE|nr:hypothetical protein ABL78_1601 [Leptomonas seymouri]|eukprot:KPI89268.1 hypothetical protein ABL78_1601 [Leptomonas seymouri]